MPTISGIGEIEAWLGATLFHEYGLYPGEEASLRIDDLGQASKEGFVVNGVVPHPPQCQTPIVGVS